MSYFQRGTQRRHTLPPVIQIDSQLQFKENLVALLLITVDL